MKYTFMFLAFLPIIVYAQLSGSYCDNSDFTSECYEFQSGNRFSSLSSGCTIGTVARGHYALHDDSITFFYEADPIDTMNKMILSENKDGQRSYADVYACDYDSLIPKAGVKVELAGYPDEWLTGSDGHCLIPIEKSDKPQKMEIHYAFFDKKFLIPPSMNCAITVYVKSSRRLEEHKAGTSQTYFLMFFDENTIQINQASLNSIRVLKKQ